MVKVLRYLDPRADLTFKKIFGEHADLATSFLNALLPLKEGEQIETVEFLPAELVPDTPLKKNTIVDVRCKDNLGRQFLVEMQMYWTDTFMQRVLFNASKAYVRQLDKAYHYSYLQPVYSLSLVNDVFEPKIKEFYHLYDIVNIEHTEKVIDGLHFVFVELPKFKPQSVLDKKMMVLWLRFLTEMHDNVREIPDEFLENPEIKKAVGLLEESSYTEAQLYGYEEFWDAVMVERTIKDDALKYGVQQGMKEGLEQGMKEGLEIGMQKGMQKGMEQGMQKGMEQGMQKGMEQGMQKGMEQGMQKGMEQGIEEGRAAMSIEIAKKLKALNYSSAEISKATGLPVHQIENL